MSGPAALPLLKLLLVTGGGGAGVSTVAAASAVHLAAPRRSVALLGTEPEPPEAWGALDESAGLTVSTPAGEAALGTDTGAARAWLGALLTWAGLDSGLLHDVSLAPGAGALTALLAAVTRVESGALAVVDLGPARAALGLLTLLAAEPLDPDQRERPARLVGRVAGPLLSRLVDLPRPDGAARAAGDEAAGRLERLRALLRLDGVAVRLVLPADGRAARLEREAATALGLHGIALDAIVHRDGVSQIAGAGGPARRLLPWSAAPPLGVAALRSAGETLYGEDDPARQLAPARRPRFELVGAGLELTLPIPARPAQECSVRRRGGRVEVHAGRWRRSFTLPEAYAGLPGRRAWHDGAAFRVRFAPD